MSGKGMITKGGMKTSRPFMNKVKGPATKAAGTVGPKGNSKMHPQKLTGTGGGMLRASAASGWSGKC